VRLALDTNSYSDLCRGVPEVVERCELADSIHLPLVVVGELRAGFAVGQHGSENERVLQQFLIQSGVEILLPDEETTFHYAAVYRQLRSQGTPIPTNDMRIAALVLQHGLVLLHRDRHFDHLPQLASIRST
jgi:predicted nucleic acid-binding protein